MRKYYIERKRNNNDKVNKYNNNRHSYYYLTTTNKIYTCNSTQYVWNMNNTIVSHDNKKIRFR